MRQIIGDSIRGHLETLVLSALERGAAHGFEILRRLEDAGEGSLKLKEGAVYPALYRLEEAGCVKGEWEGEAGGRRGPRRRIYKLTPKGRGRLAQDRVQWRTFVAVVGRIVEAGA